MSEINVVEAWLRSFGLEKYAQSFIDNGYDDLEICKQVGDPDLDAIGVDAGEERNKIIEEIKLLNEKGGTHVYLTLADETQRNSLKLSNEVHVPTRPTLENLFADVPPPAVPSPRLGIRPASALDRSSATLVTYPKLQLSVILRDKLVEDEIDLASPPYTAQDLSPCWSGLTALAVKYKDELNTHVDDVLDRLEDLRWRRIIYEDAMSIYTPPSMTSSTMEDPYSPSVYSYSPRGGPPPIPSVPPPEGSHIPQYGRDNNYGQLQSIHTRYHDTPSQANYVSLDTGMCCVFPKKVTKADTDAGSEKKKTSTLGRLFRNMGFRRSSRKHSYKKHQGTGGDPMAHEITMGDNDRIALMQMVKEGKISTETAIQVVKRFEEERKREDNYTAEKEKEKKSSSKSKKGIPTKPPCKSPSVVYTDDSQCDMCHNFMLYGYPDDCTRQRRVHSVSHIPYSDPLRSPGAPRAMSCSPMRSQSAQPSAVNSPVSYAQGSKIYTPVIPHELKMFSGHRGHYAVHGIDVLRDRLNVIKTSACVHKTQSKASLISSESDHSMDCASILGCQGKPQVEETYYCSNHSTVSMGSDTDPGANGRRKCGNTMEKQHTQKWQRTGSLSQGEDGMSTDNEELDDPDQLLLGGGTASSHMMEKFRGVKNEMRKRILQTRDIIGDGKSQHLCSAYQSAPGTSHSVSSNDSNCSSGVGSQSTHSEPQQRQQPPWMEPEHIQGHFHGNIVGHARVHSDYTPAPDEKDFLFLRRGERVQILEASSSGIWRGRIDNRVGLFHFNFVDMVAETTPTIRRKDRSYRQSKRRSKPRSVEELLQRINLEHLAPVFVSNGYDNLEIFAEIDHEDLNALSIFDSESRTKLLTAAELLNDYEVVEPVDDRASRYSRSTTATPTSQQYAIPWTSFFPAKPPTTGSRDSGCYDSSEFMNRDNYDPYACINRNRANLHDKENHRPHITKKSVKPDTTLHSDLVDLSLNFGATGQQHGISGPKGAKLEKIYSEEDREVCDITGYESNGADAGILAKVQNLATMSDVEKLEISLQNRKLTLSIPVLGPDWKVFQDTPSQTSPKYGSMSDSFHGSLDGDLSNISSSMSASAHGDFFSQSQSTLKKKSKPYARRIATVVPMKDAQVQVMCPLGLSPPQFSPGSSSVSTPTVSQSSDQIVHPASSLLLLGSNQSENGQTTSLVIAENSSPARISYLSQSSHNSREGDSGSDASTVKSDKIPDGADVKENSVKSMQEALQGVSVSKGFKSIKRSVIPKLTSKLASEDIDLSKEPYTLQCGACGIPPLLIQRYAEELKQDLYKTALILDQVRIHKLTTLGRPVVVNEEVSEASLGASELKIATIPEFFISIGLPMYAESFINKGYTNVEALATLTVKDLQSICKAEKRHLKRIIHAVEWVQNRLASPTRKQKHSPVKDRV